MEIVHEEKLVKNAIFDKDKMARKIALEILKGSMYSVNPRALVRSHVHKKNSILSVDNLTFDLGKIQRIFVVGGGKASGAMAEALEEVIEDKLTGGFINILRGTKSEFKTRKILLNEAGHPIPNENGVSGSRKIIQLLSRLNENDIVFCLISGGGSALIPLPAADISLRDQQKLTNALLKSGATIGEINTVRKHLSKLKGGQLTKVAYPATVISLILSDVVGDSLDSIASGPTAPDTTTFNDAISILRKYDLWRGTHEAIRRRLYAGSKGEIPETPKPGDKVFERTHNIIVGNNRLATLAACREAKKHGLNPLLLSSFIEGEARHIGTAYAGIMMEILTSNNPVPKPAAIVAGGETTVTITGSGKGGPNQELVLSASQKINGLKGVAIASIDTDGVDGPVDAAGAIADGQTVTRARNMGLKHAEFLMNNDSYSFFSRLDDLIFTGPTGTNVNDLSVMVVL